MCRSLSVVRMVSAVLDYNQVDYTLTFNNHAKFVLQNRGKRATVCTPLTPSDVRAIKNCFFELRRAVRGLGIELKPDSKKLIHNP